MNKTKEEYLVKHFIELRPDLAIESAVRFESPDFLCIRNGQKFGLEVTQVFLPASKGFPPQAIERYRNDLCETLRQRHITSGLSAAHVSVYLTNNDVLKFKGSREDIAECLFHFFSDAIVLCPDNGCRFESETLPQDLKEKNVEEIAVFKNKKLTEPAWTFPYARFLTGGTRELVQETICRKTKKIGEYKKNAEEIWLLIVSGAGSIQSYLEFADEIRSSTFESEFERNFLFRTFGPEVLELKRISSIHGPGTG